MFCCSSIHVPDIKENVIDKYFIKIIYIRLENIKKYYYFIIFSTIIIHFHVIIRKQKDKEKTVKTTN